MKFIWFFYDVAGDSPPPQVHVIGCQKIDPNGQADVHEASNPQELIDPWIDGMKESMGEDWDDSFAPTVCECVEAGMKKKTNVDLYDHIDIKDGYTMTCPGELPPGFEEMWKERNPKGEQMLHVVSGAAKGEVTFMLCGGTQNERNDLCIFVEGIQFMLMLNERNKKK